MGAREQRELELNQKIENEIKDAPEYIRAFFNWMNGKVPATKELYIRTVMEFLSYCAPLLSVDLVEEGKLGDINLDMLSSYMSSISIRTSEDGTIRKNASSTINVKMCAISTFYRFLIKSGKIQVNICEALDRPEIPEKDEIIYLSVEEVQKAFEAIDTDRRNLKWKKRNKLLLAFPLVTGIRISAMVNMDIEDVNMAEHTFKVIEKEGKHRKFWIPDELYEDLQEWIKERQSYVEACGGENKAMFLSVYGGECKRLTCRGVNKIIGKYTEMADKKVSAHKLRASFAMGLYDQTGDIGLVAEMLGHRSTETTKRYARATEQKKQKAVGMMSNYMGI